MKKYMYIPVMLMLSAYFSTVSPGPGGSQTVPDPCDTCECDTCLTIFKPIPGKAYVFGAWVSDKEWMSEWNTNLTLDRPQITLNFALTGGGETNIGPFKGKGDIIDGWLRIDTTFTIPALASSIQLEFSCDDCASDDTVFFDDVRIYPLGGSMKSFVYDLANMRFVAELDENNYAKMYEYDEDGVLIRVKQETVRGVETVKETRNNTVKR